MEKLESRKEKRIEKGIYLRDGSYYIDFYIAHGKRKREKIEGNSLKLARQVRNKRLTDVAEGKYLDKPKEERIKLGDFIHQFLTLHSKQRKKTWRDDTSRLSIFVEYIETNTYLDEIKPSMIHEFCKFKLETGTKPSTINRYITILKTMFNKAEDWGYKIDNPMRKVKLHREDNARLRFLEKEEITRLLEASDKRLKPIVVTALNTGMRKMEILNLKWSDVDFRRGIITIYETKNNDVKVIPINDVLRRTLACLREHSTSEQVFDTTGFRKDFANALKCAKITNCRFHDLRHTFASHLVMEGIDLVTVKELMGHKSIRMTMRYSHLSQDHKIKAVQVLGNTMDTLKPPSESLAELENTLNAVTTYKT
ncbi:MAG: site-specific integrase [Candidatus Omnitrophica bacterium]|nr:site-specific integrase [Candidatus Omnitrophota bacterium]